MERYKIIKQALNDERTFTLEHIKTGERYEVDIFTDGKLIQPKEYEDLCQQDRHEEAGEVFGNWLKSLVGKQIEIERISPYLYFSGGETRIIQD